MTAMSDCTGACGIYVPQLHIGPQTCEEKAEARRHAREAFTHDRPFDHKISTDENKTNLDKARQDAQHGLGTAAGGEDLQSSPLGPVTTQKADGTLFLVQQLAQEFHPDAPPPLTRRAAEASGVYNAAPSSRIYYDGPQIALDILA